MFFRMSEESGIQAERKMYANKQKGTHVSKQRLSLSFGCGLSIVCLLGCGSSFGVRFSVCPPAKMVDNEWRLYGETVERGNDQREA